MTVQISDIVRNARLDAIETTIGVSPTLDIYDGLLPNSCADAPTGNLLVSIALPSDWLSSASEGNISDAGTWSGIVSTSGSAAYFRINQGATCHIQGVATQVGYGGELGLENTELVLNDDIVIASFTLTEANS